MQTTTSRAALVVTVAVAGLVTLSACSAQDGTTRPSSSPSASASAKAGADRADKAEDRFLTPPADLPEHEATCADGVATIDQPNAKIVLDGACAKVVVDASNSVVELGATDDLVVKGSINSVTAKGVKTLSVTGNGNHVTLDSKPKVSDKGTENVVDGK